MLFETFLERDCDVVDRVCALLSWRELHNVSVCCRTALTSRLRVTFLTRTGFVLPPHRATCDAIFASAITQSSAVRCLTIPPSASCVDSSAARACAWLTGVEELTITRTRFALPSGFAVASMDIALVVDIFPRLQQLSLARVSDFVDATPLAQLEQLRRLNLSATGVRNLAPLTSLRHLEFLDVSETSVTTLEPLQHMHTLQKIVLDVYPESHSLAALAACPNAPAIHVKRVEARGDLVEEDLRQVAPLITAYAMDGYGTVRSSETGFERRRQLLASMGNVMSLVVVDSFLRCRLDEVFPRLGKLRVLRISGLRSGDISALAALKLLEVLTLTSELSIDLSPLASLPHLWSLECRAGHLSSTESRGGLTELIHLRHLKVLGIPNDYLQRIRGLDVLEELIVFCSGEETLQLPRGCAPCVLKLHINGVVDLRELHPRFPVLRSLVVEDFEFDHLDAQNLGCFEHLEALTLLYPSTFIHLPTQPMPQLRKLGIRYSREGIYEFESVLEMFPNLRELDLEGTTIKDISPIIVLQELEVVKLDGTQVRDVTPLLRLRRLVSVTLHEFAHCTPLANAYHDKTVLPELREVLHPTENCLWGSWPHWGGHTRKRKCRSDPPEEARTGCSRSNKT